MPPAAVLIAGAGPTGLILALLLTRLSIPFRIVDQAARSGTTSRAIVVHARTLELYRQLGLAGAVAAAGQKLQSARFTAHGTVLASAPLGDLGAGLSPFPFVLALPQDEHERVLEARLEELGARVERGVELVGCVPREGGCEVTLRVVDGGGEESVQVAYVVGCDGAHSAVRRLAGITMAGGTYLQRFFVADVDLAGDWAEGDGAVARDNLDICIGGNDFCIVLPFGRKGAVRLIGIVPKGLEEREDLDFEHVRESVRANTKLEVQRVGWFATYKVHHRVADRFREGRVFLCGDACHLHRHGLNHPPPSAVPC
jgi:2-polyprenyl-6-methoxyphenol hydroxylase-like FAD-dependent oxidoreductase